MILLCCKRLPENISRSELALRVRLGFPNKANADYITSLEQKASTESALESLLALSTLRDLIPQLPCDINAAELVLSRTESGKPYFLNSNLKFNLSHSGGVVACALSDEGEVGIDIECAEKSDGQAIKIAKRFFSQDDSQAISKDPSSFTRVWSEKEAQSKFFGMELSKFLDSEKNGDDFAPKNKLSINVALHRFTYCKMPVTLCTTRDFSTIKFIFST